jgi:uncharacterized protein YfaS (alpha-2-macroglobulin family)
MKKAPLFLSLALGALALLIVGGLWLSPLNARKTLPRYNSAFDAYLSAFTAGEISRQSDITIRFAKPLVDSTLIGQEVQEALFSFDPPVEGKAHWKDPQTLVFSPAQPLQAQKVYLAELAVGELMEIAPELQQFAFHFRTRPQAIQLNMLELKVKEQAEQSWQSLRGEVRTLDTEAPEAIEAMFSARLQNQRLKVAWTHPEPNRHLFQIDSIARQADPQWVRIAWDGKDAGLEIEGEKKIEIPALGNFRVLAARKGEQQGQQLVLEFSDPLLPSQNLKGLVRLGDQKITCLVEGNLLKVFPKRRLKGEVKLRVEPGIESRKGHRIQEAFEQSLTFEASKPQVKLVGKGVIIPQSQSLPFIFEAVGLNAIDVRVIRIFEDNVPQFLQTNRLEDEKELKRVGRIVARKTFRLDEDKSVDLRDWSTHALDLSELIKTEPGAIYQVAIGFRKSQYLDACGASNEPVNLNDKPEKDMLAMEWDWDTYEESQDDSYWDYWEEDYNYRYRDNPCKNEYYHSGRVVKRNVLASDLGLIAKRGDDELFVAVTDLKSTRPKANVTLEAFNYQNQSLATATTDAEGKARLSLPATPYLLIAKEGSQRGYLRLDDGSSLSLSRFDIQGVSYQRGLKGYLYGERGVWRPGDNIYLHFILEDQEKELPADHPVIFELFNPKGQRVDRQMNRSGLNGFYAFQTRTAANALTGNYLARVSVGGVEFKKSLKVETIVPNRLKLMLDFGEEALSQSTSDKKATLEARWLHGAIARNLDAEVNVSLRQGSTSFPKYLDYQFDDPVRRFGSQENTLFKGQLDAEGKAMVPCAIKVSGRAPGKLQANFITRVMEPGGNASTDRFSLPYHPYEVYSGVKLPKGDAARGMLLTDEDHPVDIVTLDKNGKPVSRSGLKVSLYKISWKWWWDKSGDEDLGAYIGRENIQPISQGTINTVNGKGQWKLRVNYPDWGRYLVRVEDPGGHATGKVVYIDWPGWAGRAQDDNPGGAKMLVFASDKKQYRVGEEITLTLPTGQGGRALVSIEKGSKVLDSYWVEAEKGSTRFSFTASPEMAPTVYAHVTLLQPHAQTANDLPMRLYGVIPIKVENPATVLQPQISMADELQPMEEVVIKVGEKGGGPMTYTLAVVDEGLLGLTRFRTPNPHGHFYRREALQVKTWDLFDQVVGAYGGELTSLLSIGGDGEGLGADGKKPDRFKPVVKVLGPFSLKAGETQTHRFMMPNYIGAVRTMVVAGQEGAYGFAEKETPVKKPLMVLGTLPRVIGPGEAFQLPVTVFALEENIREVDITLETNELLSAVGTNAEKLRFSQVGEKMATLGIQVNEMLGVGSIKITARSGGEVATYEADIEVRPSNPLAYQSYAEVINPGENWKRRFRPLGMKGTNAYTLEVSNVPPLNLGKRLKYLIRYPYGCIEQTTSSVFPQIYLSRLLQLEEDRKAEIDNNVMAGIQRLQSFQLADGSMAYWPGNGEANAWGTNYAGHFLLEARQAGYSLPAGLLENWTSYQASQAQNWTWQQGNRQDLIQAYRLYLLALAGEEDLGSMNRMRQSRDKLGVPARWYLAAAYQLAGQQKTARELIQGQQKQVAPYTELGNTYGSTLRDQAIILQCLSLMGEREDAFPLVESISKTLCSEKWLNTQATAYSLVALARYLGESGKAAKMKFTCELPNGDKQKVEGEKPLWQIQGRTDEVAGIGLSNKGKSILYVRVVQEGIPLRADTSRSSSGLTFSVSYQDRDGKALDVKRLPQGADILASVTVVNTGNRGKYEEIALNQLFPAGWEIHNHRLDGTDPGGSTPEFQDIRDDRVYTFFDLDQGRARTFNVRLTAAYKGRYYLPALAAHAMYDRSINARRPGQWVEVVSAGGD